MKYKNIISLTLILSIIISYISILPIEANAETNASVAKYVGTFDSATDMQFEIYNIDTENNTFNGHLYLHDSAQTIDTDVSGTITIYEDYYTCNFDFRYKWIVWQSGYMDLRMDRETGVATGTGGGGGLLFASNDIYLLKEFDTLFDSNLEINESDMILCMNLSNVM